MKNFKSLLLLATISFAGIAGFNSSSAFACSCGDVEEDDQPVTVSPAITVINQTSARIVSIQMTDVGRDNWGHNLIEQSVRPGWQTTIDPSHRGGYCDFDVRVKFADGTQGEVRDFDACQTDSLKLNDKAMYVQSTDGDVVKVSY